MRKLNFTNQFIMNDQPLEICGTVYPGSPATREEPEEPDDIEILDVIHKGVDILPFLHGLVVWSTHGGAENLLDVIEAMCLGVCPKRMEFDEVTIELIESKGD